MALPNDPIMLLSMINLKLRDFYPTLTRCARIWTRTRPRCVPGFPLWGTSMTPSAINLCDNRRMLP